MDSGISRRVGVTIQTKEMGILRHSGPLLGNVYMTRFASMCYDVNHNVMHESLGAELWHSMVGRVCNELCGEYQIEMRKVADHDVES